MLFFLPTSLKILDIESSSAQAKTTAMSAFFALYEEKIASQNLGRLFITYSLNIFFDVKTLVIQKHLK